jgi:hypothetical protein
VRAGLTTTFPFKTAETVATETPASRATSWIVAFATMSAAAETFRND